MPRRSGPSPQSTTASPFRAGFHTGPWFWALVFLLTLIAYWPAVSADFIWDDNRHVTRPELQSLAGLGRIWFEIGATQQYYPVLHSAFWLEHQLWGDAPLGYHLLNILLHATAACLFAVVLRRLAVPGATLAALLFALHPVCVESVAWVSEQKNTLSTVFYLGAALSYLKFNDRRLWSQYLLATVLFIFALLTKTVTATLPAALLVIFWWKEGQLRWRRDILPLLPWLVVGAAAGLFTAHFEKTMIGAQGEAFVLGVFERFLLAGQIFWFYLGKLLWPANLTFIYPRWIIDAPSASQWVYLLAAISLITFAVFAVNTRAWGRSLLAALLLFGGTLFPVLGFFNVYPFIFSYVADHFQYLASLAIFALVSAALVRGFTTFQRPVFLTSSILLLIVLAVLTRRQSGMYQNEFTLYETTLARNPAAWMAHNNLALALTRDGRVEEAVRHLEAVLKVRPNYPQAESNLGDNLTRLGRAREAIPHLERAVQLQPDFANAHNNLGSALAAENRLAEAIQSFEAALRHNPDLGVAHRNLGFAIASSGRNADAIPNFERAALLDPSDSQAQLGLGIALALTDRFDEASAHFKRAIQLSPTSTDAYLTYARALAQHGESENAVLQLRAVLEIAPDLADAHVGLAVALRQLGRVQEAQYHLRQAEQLAPR